MQDRSADGWTTRAISLALFVLGAALAGCSSSGDHLVTFFADPGKYQYHNCDQLAAARTQTDRRRTELQLLIEQAEKGVAGAVVSTIAYRGEHRTVVEELMLIEKTARTKNCLTEANWRSNAVIR